MIFDSITLGVALLGAVLGVLNMWHQLRRDLVRLIVRPNYAIPCGPGGPGRDTLSIEVVNLSTFPVTIAEVGLELHDGKHMIDPQMRSTQRGRLPIRLDTRESLTVLWDADFLDDPAFKRVKKAYARCECGTKRYGRSPALAGFVSKSRHAGQRSRSQ